MNVTVRDLTEAARPPRRAPDAGLIAARMGRTLVCLLGLVIALVGWIFGARYTIDGVIIILNAILRFLHFTTQVTITHGSMYLWLGLIPVAASLVEWTCAPQRGTIRVSLGFILLWMIVIVLDFGSTFAGLLADLPRTSALVRDIISNIYVAGGLTAVLTILPEWFGRWMVRGLRRTWR